MYNRKWNPFVRIFAYHPGNYFPFFQNKTKTTLGISVCRTISLLRMSTTTPLCSTKPSCLMKRTLWSPTKGTLHGGVQSLPTLPPCWLCGMSWTMVPMSTRSLCSTDATWASGSSRWAWALNCDQEELRSGTLTQPLKCAWHCLHWKRSRWRIHGFWTLTHLSVLPSALWGLFSLLQRWWPFIYSMWNRNSVPSVKASALLLMRRSPRWRERQSLCFLGSKLTVNALFPKFSLTPTHSAHACIWVSVWVFMYVCMCVCKCFSGLGTLVFEVWSL